MTRFVSLVSLVNCPVVERLLVVSTWGGETGSPSLKATGDFSVCRDFFEEEGLHARPFLHIFGEYFCVDAAYLGRGRIGTLPSSTVCTSEGKGQALFLPTSVTSSEKEGTGLPPRMAGKYFEFEEQIWDVPAIPWSVGWSSTCTGRHRSGRICDAMRCVGETDRGLDRAV